MRKSYVEKLKKKVDEYEQYYRQNPVPTNTTQWWSKDVVINLLNQKGRYAIELGFRPDGVVVWRESRHPNL